VVVVLAGLLLASVTGFASIKTLDTETDEELTAVLSAASVVERFQERQGDLEQSRQEAISPLVREAEQYALILDPPKPVQERTNRIVRDTGRPRRPNSTPVVTTAKFELVGTSYSAAGQADCLAYIRMQDGKTYKWVEVGDVIGHMTIKQINRDSIVCWDGNRDVPLSIPERVNTANLLEGGATMAGGAASPAMLRLNRERSASAMPVNPVSVRPISSERITGTSSAPINRPTSLRQTPVGAGNPLAPRVNPSAVTLPDELAATIHRVRQAREGSEEQAAEYQSLIEGMNQMHADITANRLAEREQAGRDAGRPAGSPLRGRSTPTRRMPTR
jgi:hypothetical protein